MKIKNYIILILGLLFVQHSLAQQGDSSDKVTDARFAPFYIGFSSGINNHNGLIGINIEIPLANQFSISSGVGLGSWGTKYYGQALIYFEKNCHRAGAISFGITRATGAKNQAIKAETTSGTHDVDVSGTAATNGFASFYHFFNMGKNSHKFYLQLGYSFRITKPTYIIDSRSLLTENGEKTVKMLAPGGFIFGLGVYLGVH